MGVLTKHFEYGTILYEERNEEIIGFTRFNIETDTCYCLDAVVRPDYRFKRLLKLFLIKGLKKFPNVTKLCFRRYFKKKDWKTYDIYKVLGVKHDTKQV